MEFAARQFARRVLLFHFGLLLLVLLAVGLAAKYLYAGARQQVIQQAEGTQRLLARQTALGVQNYYESITSVLNLLQPPEGQSTTQPMPPPPQALPPRPPGGRKFSPEEHESRRNRFESGMFSNMLTRFGTVIWSNVDDKANLLFIVDTVDDMNVLKVLGSSPGTTDPHDVVKSAREWLATVKTESISAYFPDISGGAHLISVPVRQQGGVQMVAVVPVSNVEKHLLQFVNRSPSQRAALVDTRGRIISASREEIRGKSTSDISDPRVVEMGKNALILGVGDTRTMETTATIGGFELHPAMITVEPITMGSSDRWLVVISSGLSDVDDLVQPIFHDALVWAIVLVVAVTAILASTAILMIRSRLRLERRQMEMINKEMEQARLIQLSWLPDQPCPLKGIDIAAVNTPASHVSGDFYNWFELPDGKIAVIIGDVTGHGMSAAFLMATTQLLVRTNLPRVVDPGYCLEEVNRQLCTQVFNGQFVTMQILVIDLENRVVDIASSGHPAPLICQSDSVTPMAIDPQLVMGVELATEYPTQRFPLAPGAALLLYTDGVTDAVSPAGQRFTIEGLRGTLGGRIATAQQMLERVIRGVENFRIGRDLSDDLTLVAVQFAPVEATLEKVAVLPGK